MVDVGRGEDVCVQAAKTVSPGAKGCGWECMVQGRTSPQPAGAYLNTTDVLLWVAIVMTTILVEGIGLFGFAIACS